MKFENDKRTDFSEQLKFLF